MKIKFLMTVSPKKKNHKREIAQYKHILCLRLFLLNNKIDGKKRSSHHESLSQ